MIASERVKGINQIDDDEDELELVSWMEPAHGDWRLSAEAEAARSAAGDAPRRPRAEAGPRPGAEWAASRGRAAGGLVGRRRFGGQVEAQRRAGVAQRRRCWPPRVFRFQRFAPGRLGQHTLASVESDAKGDRNLGSGQVGSVNVRMAVECGLWVGLWATLRLELNKRLRITENNKLRP